MCTPKPHLTVREDGIFKVKQYIKDNNQRVKSQTKLWAKIFANHLSDKVLISKICNKLLQLNNKQLGDDPGKWPW